MPESAPHQLAVALRQTRASVTTQEDLAATLGESQSWVSRRESGEVEPTPSELARIEAALKVAAGTVYRLAGLVDDEVSTRAAIAIDPSLSPEARLILLGAYDASVAGSRRRGDA